MIAGQRALLPAGSRGHVGEPPRWVELERDCVVTVLCTERVNTRDHLSGGRIWRGHYYRAVVRFGDGTRGEFTTNQLRALEPATGAV